MTTPTNNSQGAEAEKQEDAYGGLLTELGKARRTLTDRIANMNIAYTHHDKAISETDSEIAKIDALIEKLIS